MTGLSWVKATPDKLRLAPGEIRKVTVSIIEPKSATPGQRYVAAEFMAKPTKRAKGQVATRIAVAGELLIDTPGALKETASYSLHLPSISWGGPVTLAATVRATGNTYVFVHNEHATEGALAIRLPNALTLAGTQRTISASFTPGWGYHTVTWEGQTAHVLVVPLVPILALLAIIGGLGVILFAMKKQKRRARSRRHSRKPVQA